MRRSALFSTFLWLSLLLACSDPEVQIEQDKQIYDPISTTRSPGTTCYPGDSADIQRQQVHPRGPTGGWYGSRPQLDPNRQADQITNQLDWIGGDLAGYVRFPVAGRLQMRSYDDLYGAVYCGWSPDSIDYDLSENSTYVTFSPCSVGDGGLDQVHELCWFPEHEEVGSILYSTAFPDPRDLSPHLIFLPRHIGRFSSQGDEQIIYYYNDREANQIFHSLLAADQIEQTRHLISTQIANIEFLPDAIEGTTGKPLPSFQVHCDQWLDLLLLQAGLELADPISNDALSRIQQILSQGQGHCSTRSTRIVDLMDYYRWTVDQMQGLDSPIPPPPDRPYRARGYDPQLIAQILMDPRLTDETLGKSRLSAGGQSSYFWLGLREYLDGDQKQASRYLTLFIDHSRPGSHTFERAAAAALRARIDLAPDLRSGN